MNNKVFEEFERIRFERWFDVEFPLARETVEHSSAYKFMFESWLACAALRVSENSQEGEES